MAMYDYCPIPQHSGRGTTPLHEVARHGSVVAVRVLLDAGADVNAKVCGGLYLLNMVVSSAYV